MSYILSDFNLDTFIQYALHSELHSELHRSDTLSQASERNVSVAGA